MQVTQQLNATTRIIQRVEQHRHLMLNLTSCMLHFHISTLIYLNNLMRLVVCIIAYLAHIGLMNLLLQFTATFHSPHTAVALVAKIYITNMNK